MIIYGIHSVESKLINQPKSIRQIYISAEHNPKIKYIKDQAQQQKINVKVVDKSTIIKMVGVKANHQGIVCEYDHQKNQYHSLGDFLKNHQEGAMQLLALDQINDPRNLGACIRSADAFGAKAVIIPKDRSVNITQVVTKTSSGALDNVPIITTTNFARALDDIADSYFEILGLASDVKNNFWQYCDQKMGARVCWVLGGEGQGLRRLSREKCQFLLSIPMVGIVESLNVSVSAGICLGQYQRRFG